MTDDRRDGERRPPGPIALHGGGEYVAGDEAAMDALLAAAAGAGRRPRSGRRHRADGGRAPAARAAASARRAGVPAAAARAGIGVARRDRRAILTRDDADDPELVETLEVAHLIHFPGGDPDLIPAVLPRHARVGGDPRGARAGARASPGRARGRWRSASRLLDVRAAASTGWGCCRATPCIPHFAPGRLRGWRRAVEDGTPLRWLGLDEQTLVIGRPGGSWTVAGRGRAHVIPPGSLEPTIEAPPGSSIPV